MLDYAIVNNGEITEEMIKDFNQEESTPVKIDLENIQNRAISVIREDLVLATKSGIIHDTKRLSEIIIRLAKSRRTGDLTKFLSFILKAVMYTIRAIIILR